MGGGIYSQDVARQARSSNQDAFTRSAYVTTDRRGESQRGLHPALSPYQTVREVQNETPIVVALDVTRSRGDDTKLVYERLPMLMGQIELKGYVKNPGISFAAIGDAVADQAPLQVGQFEADNRLDEMLARMWIEEGGGGTGQESYELAAYYYSRTDCVRLREGRGGKGFFFFVGDEGFYPRLDRLQVRRVIGDELPDDLPADAAFRALQEKFEVFLIYPKTSLEARKKDIDAEIKQRVTAAGGLYEGVDVRASLIWNNRNDLDLHVVAPSGEEVFFGNKKSRCRGWLDVDMNVRGETTKPVENVRWAKGEAPSGRYKVFVQLFSFKEPKQTATEFKVEIEVGGELRHYSGTVSPNREWGPASNVMVAEFDFDRRAGGARPAERGRGGQDKYAQYTDEVILAQWASVIPREHILRIADPRAIIDVLLGALALKGGAVDLETYLGDLAQREHGGERLKHVREALAPLAAPRPGAATVEGHVPRPDRAADQPRRTKRLR